MDKLLLETTWEERWDLSIKNAMATYERHQPKEMFWCLVEKKYKTTIWNTAIKKVNAKNKQLTLEM